MKPLHVITVSNHDCVQYNNVFNVFLFLAATFLRQMLHFALFSFTLTNWSQSMDQQYLALWKF